MTASHHRTERLNVTNAAKRLGMSVPALGERIKRGDIETEFIAGYTFVPLEELGRFRAAREEERKAAAVAEQDRAADEQREEDGRRVAQLVGEAQGIAEKYGWAPPEEG